MKRLLSLLVIASLLIVPSAHSAPKKLAVKPLQLLTTVGTPDEVSGVVSSGKSLIVFGSKASKAYARAVDTAGKELWSLSLDQSPASIATAALSISAILVGAPSANASITLPKGAFLPCAAGGGAYGIESVSITPSGAKAIALTWVATGGAGAAAGGRGRALRGRV